MAIGWWVDEVGIHFLFFFSFLHSTFSSLWFHSELLASPFSTLPRARDISFLLTTTSPPTFSLIVYISLFFPFHSSTYVRAIIIIITQRALYSIRD
jgi:hypothetical protein